MSDLKPCPFCGDEAHLIYHGFLTPADIYEDMWSCECAACGASLKIDHMDKARCTEEWNTRPADDLNADLVDALKKAKTCNLPDDVSDIINDAILKARQ